MIEFGNSSHVGLRRELNEDTYYSDAELGLWLVADGMGGHEFGEVASALARDAVVREIRAGRSLSEAIRSADEDIIRQSKRRDDSLPMGTTVVALQVTDHHFELAWVGDSRAYLWNGQLRQISSDHSYVQELIDQGAITAGTGAQPSASQRGHPGAGRDRSGIAQGRNNFRRAAAGLPDPAVQRRPDRGSGRRRHCGLACPDRSVARRNASTI